MNQRKEIEGQKAGNIQIETPNAIENQISYLVLVSVADQDYLEGLSNTEKKKHLDTHNELLQFADSCTDDGVNTLEYIRKTEKEAIETGLKILAILKRGLQEEISSLIDCILIYSSPLEPHLIERKDNFFSSWLEHVGISMDDLKH